ncbi:proteasome subunit beta type-11a [Aplochiton taeniatus]
MPSPHVSSLNRYSPVPSPYSSSAFVRRPFPLSHGTTTLAFVFQGGVIAAADTRASAGGLVACPFVHKITPLHSHLVVTSSGSGADCMLWERILTREIRLYHLRHRRRLSISGTAKLLSHMLHPFKGTDVCVALILCGWDEEQVRVEDCKAENVEAPEDTAAFALENVTSADNSITEENVIGVAPNGTEQTATDVGHSLSPVSGLSGPKLIYVCSDGARLQGELFSVGSGSPYAYGVLDRGFRWNLSREEATSLAREAVFRATHRDAYSGNNVDLFYVSAKGWSCREREDLKEEYYRERERMTKRVKGEMFEKDGVRE